MKTKDWLRAICMGAASVTGSVALAQGPAVAKVVAPEQLADKGVETRVSDFMGTEIVLQTGDSLGVVKDLVISNSTGSVQYVIVANENNEYRAIPWKSLAFYQGSDVDDRYFILGMEKDQYSKAPVISQQEWVTFSTPTWSAYVPQVNQYYSEVRPPRPAAVRRERRIERRNN